MAMIVIMMGTMMIIVNICIAPLVKLSSSLKLKVKSKDDDGDDGYEYDGYDDYTKLTDFLLLTIYSITP